MIDSGLDVGHPDFAGRVFAGKSFVPETWRRDTDGHGTFVAGILAANPFNGVGIAGIGFNVQLLIGKVVGHARDARRAGDAAAGVRDRQDRCRTLLHVAALVPTA